MAAAVRNGQRVMCVTATKGEAGIQDPIRWPPETLGAARAGELANALERLGITEHAWLGYRDGDCDKVAAKEAAQKLAEILEYFKPDTILTFGPEGMTGHPDHQAVSRWVDMAVGQAISRPRIYHSVQLRDVFEKYLKKADQKLNIFYNLDQPLLVDESECEICFTATNDILQQKHQALQAMPSQTAAMLKFFPLGKLTEAFATEAFVDSSGNESEIVDRF